MAATQGEINGEINTYTARGKKIPIHFMVIGIFNNQGVLGTSVYVLPDTFRPHFGDAGSSEVFLRASYKVEINYISNFAVHSWV